MSWIIERDRNGQPERMVWAPGADEYVAGREMERRLLIAKNAAPMPAMRAWAEKHGIKF